MNSVHKMEIFTSVKLSSSFAPHERDRQGGREREPERGRDRKGQTQYMAVCDRLCLHEAVCDACTMFVPLFMCTVYVPHWVCVLNSVVLSGRRC